MCDYFMSKVTNLEGPQEVGGSLEVVTHSVDFMDKILNTNDALGLCKILNH